MARISGVDLPREKRVEIGLTYIYGIGVPSSNRILSEAGVNPDTRVKDLTDDEVKKIAEVIAKSQMVEGDLRREVAMNIKRLEEIGCYRGIRHQEELAVSRSEDQDQCKNLQRSQKDSCKQEEGLRIA
jgi:small subunit ribosomal protein S13